MSNLLAKLESRLMPIAQFFGSQRHFIAVRDGIVSAIPFTIIGSLFLIIALRRLLRISVPVSYSWIRFS